MILHNNVLHLRIEIGKHFTSPIQIKVLCRSIKFHLSVHSSAPHIGFYAAGRVLMIRIKLFEAYSVGSKSNTIEFTVAK